MGDHVNLPAGDWSVSGVHVNDKYEDVTMEFGAPLRTITSRGVQIYVFDEPDLTLEVDDVGRIQEVSGTSLMHNGVAVLSTGQPGSAVESALGLGYRIKRFSDKTAGVFTVGSVHTSTVYYYRNGDSRFHVNVYHDGRITGITAESLERADESLPRVLTNGDKTPLLDKLATWFREL